MKDNIPAHKNCQNCGACCGIIPASETELKAIKKHLRKVPHIRKLASERQEIDKTNCPFRNDEKRRCDIYRVRPTICGLMGVVKGLRCKHGNSAELDGRVYLQSHRQEPFVILNAIDWSNP